MVEEKWYTMMGISKIFLRNFVIGCFAVCLSTIAVLANLLKAAYNDMRVQDKEHAIELKEVKAEANVVSETKNKEYITLLRDVFKNQSEIDKEIIKLKSNIRK